MLFTAAKRYRVIIQALNNVIKSNINFRKLPYAVNCAE